MQIFHDTNRTKYNTKIQTKQNTNTSNTKVTKKQMQQITLWFSTTIGDNAKVYSFSPVLGE